MLRNGVKVVNCCQIMSQDLEVHALSAHSLKTDLLSISDGNMPLLKKFVLFFRLRFKNVSSSVDF